MRWNMMATFFNLNPSIVEALKLFSFGAPTYHRRDENLALPA